MWPEGDALTCAQVDLVSAALASAHTPLVLLCAGVLLSSPQPRAPQARRCAFVSPHLLQFAHCS